MPDVTCAASWCRGALIKMLMSRDFADRCGLRAEQGIRSKELRETLRHPSGCRHTGVMRFHISRYYRNVTGME